MGRDVRGVLAVRDADRQARAGRPLPERVDRRARGDARPPQPAHARGDRLPAAHDVAVPGRLRRPARRPRRRHRTRDALRPRPRRGRLRHPSLLQRPHARRDPRPRQRRAPDERRHRPRLGRPRHQLVRPRAGPPWLDPGAGVGPRHRPRCRPARRPRALPALRAPRAHRPARRDRRPCPHPDGLRVAPRRGRPARVRRHDAPAPQRPGHRDRGAVARPPGRGSSAAAHPRAPRRGVAVARGRQHVRVPAGVAPPARARRAGPCRPPQ